ncbi:unnamed protein product [Heligmosomoides polygyrus]|uniref:HTH_48 domain-containing protein n=1 Tax=Heligmosomoides polygyrus TaxID=6339 RepID=A0A183G4H7_HELPZ|nr:unnamed protein product [Heligmosomoides polygyrus]
MDKRVIRGIYLYEFKLGATVKEADEKINAHSVKDVPQFGRRIVGIRSSGMEMRAWKNMKVVGGIVMLMRTR